MTFVVASAPERVARLEVTVETVHERVATLLLVDMISPMTVARLVLMVVIAPERVPTDPDNESTLEPSVDTIPESVVKFVERLPRLVLSARIVPEIEPISLARTRRLPESAFCARVSVKYKLDHSAS